MTSSKQTIVDLPYGTSFLKVQIPTNNLVSVLKRKKSRQLNDEIKEISERLKNPINSLPLNSLPGKTDKVVIITTDNTRACPDDRLLPPILEAIEPRIPRRNIIIVVALGLHHPLSKKELVKKLGCNIVKNYNVINHDVNDVVDLGITHRGTPVGIFKKVIEADIKISTGFIEPHFFAGFSGGRKSISPGVSGERTICHNHSYQMLDDKRSRAGVLHGNPVHEDMVEQAKMAGLNFIINVLLNKKGKITDVFAGDPVLAHEKGCERERHLATASINHKVDISVVTCGGAPLDMDLYQTCKAIDTAAQITRSGGIIIVASRCDAGKGPDSFYDLHSSAGSPSDVLERIKRGEPAGVPWQNQLLARAQLDHEVFLMSSLKPEQVHRMKMTAIPSVEEGIARALTALGKSAEIAVIPQGPHVLPSVERDESVNDY
jgi:nickel-dependent lactate racemase